MKKALLFGLALILILGACSANRQKLSPQSNLDLKSANVYFQQTENEASLDKALKLYENVLKDNPEHVTALKRSADIYLYRSEDLEPEKVEKDTLVEFKNMENASRVISMFQTTYARYSSVLKVMDTFEKLNDKEKAIKRDSQRKKESSWVRMFKIGQLQFEKGKMESDSTMLENSIATFEMIHKLDESRQEPLRMLVAVNQEIKDNVNFEKYLNLVLAVSPDDQDMIKLKGANLYNKGQYAEAAEIFRTIMVSKPLDVDNMLLLSSCYTETEDYQSALVILDRILKLEPENLEVLDYARVSAEILNNKTAEIDYWKRILALDSSVDRLQAFCYRMYGLKEYAVAMPYAEMWYEKAPTDAIAVTTCVRLAQEIGRPDLEKKYSDIYKRLR